MIVITVIATMGYHGLMYYVRPWFLLIPFLLMAWNGRIKDAILYSIIYFLVFFYDKWMFFLPETGFFRDIVRMLVGIITMMMPFFAMGAYIIRTTRVSEFIAAMQNMHVTPKIVIPFVVLFRFFPTVSEEYSSIKDAMRMRGITLASGPVAILEYRLVPLMISLVKIGDDLSAAASARGLSADKRRTNLCELYWTIWDILIFLVSAAVMTVFVLVEVRVL